MLLIDAGDPSGRNPIMFWCCFVGSIVLLGFAEHRWLLDLNFVCMRRTMEVAQPGPLILGGIMDVETARNLTDAVATATGIALDCRNKLSALEKLLQRYDANLFERYLKFLDEIRHNPPTSLADAGLENLQSKLANG